MSKYTCNNCLSGNIEFAEWQYKEASAHVVTYCHDCRTEAVKNYAIVYENDSHVEKGIQEPEWLSQTPVKDSILSNTLRFMKHFKEFPHIPMFSEHRTKEKTLGFITQELDSDIDVCLCGKKLDSPFQENCSECEAELDNNY